MRIPRGNECYLYANQDGITLSTAVVLTLQGYADKLGEIKYSYLKKHISFKIK